MTKVAVTVGLLCVAVTCASSNLRGQKAGEPWWQEQPQQFSTGLDQYPAAGDITPFGNAGSLGDIKAVQLQESLQDSLAKEKGAELKAAELAYQAMHASTSAEERRDAAASAFSDWMEASAQVKAAQQRATQAAALQASHVGDPVRDRGIAEKEAMVRRAQNAEEDAMISARAAAIADEVARNAEAVVKATEQIREDQASSPRAPVAHSPTAQVAVVTPAAAAPVQYVMPLPLIPNAGGGIPQSLQYAAPAGSTAVQPLVPVPMQLAVPVPVRLAVPSVAMPVATVQTAPVAQAATQPVATPLVQPNGTLSLHTLPAATFVARPTGVGPTLLPPARVA